MQRRHVLQTHAGLAVATVAPWALAQTRPQVEVWKDPDCGCCKEWVAHLQSSDFQVQVHDVGNAQARKRLGMSDTLGSCHTAVVGGYAIEGHVPAQISIACSRKNLAPWDWPCPACPSAHRAWMRRFMAGGKTRTT